MTIATITKVTTKLVMYSYVNKMVLTATIADYKLEVAHSALNTIMVLGTIGLAIKPSQTKATTQSVES